MIDVKDYDIPYRLGSTRVKPSNGMDNLSRDSCAALEAGMSLWQVESNAPTHGRA